MKDPHSLRLDSPESCQIILHFKKGSACQLAPQLHLSFHSVQGVEDVSGAVDHLAELHGLQVSVEILQVESLLQAVDTLQEGEPPLYLELPPLGLHDLTGGPDLQPQRDWRSHVGTPLQHRSPGSVSVALDTMILKLLEHF